MCQFGLWLQVKEKMFLHLSSILLKYFGCFWWKSAEQIQWTKAQLVISKQKAIGCSSSDVHSRQGGAGWDQLPFSFSTFEFSNKEARMVYLLKMHLRSLNLPRVWWKGLQREQDCLLVAHLWVYVNGLQTSPFHSPPTHQYGHCFRNSFWKSLLLFILIGWWNKRRVEIK